MAGKSNARCMFCHDPLASHTDSERRSCEMDLTAIEHQRPVLFDSAGKADPWEHDGLTDPADLYGYTAERQAHIRAMFDHGRGGAA